MYIFINKIVYIHNWMKFWANMTYKNSLLVRVSNHHFFLVINTPNYPKKPKKVFLIQKTFQISLIHVL